ncbi:MAG: hypothetical protein JW836_13260 [Deltaproteobacteria bacterium]|nr:hypothetical protein [Deltaproteobacteria bacterium]
MKNQAMVDGRVIDMEIIPWNTPVSGEEIKMAVARQAGRAPDGAVCVSAPGGKLIHVGAEERVQLQGGERISFTPTFETA